MAKSGTKAKDEKEGKAAQPPTSDEKQAYLEEVQAAQEEAAQADLEPPSGEITESDWALMCQRRSQGDADLLFDIVIEHGGVTIVPDPEAPEEPPAENGGGEGGGEEPAPSA